MLPVYLYYGDRYREYRQHTHKEHPMKRYFHHSNQDAA